MTSAEQSAEQGEVVIDEPDLHPVVVALYNVVTSQPHADTCGVEPSPDENYPCSCWKVAVLDAVEPLTLAPCISVTAERLEQWVKDAVTQGEAPMAYVWRVLRTVRSRTYNATRERAHPTSHAISTPRRPAMPATQHAPNCTHSCDYNDNPQDLHDPACTHSCDADTLVAPPSGTVERPMPVDSCAVIGARHLCDGTDHRRVPTRDQVKRSLTEHVSFISAAISGSYPTDIGVEAHMWRRVMKVAEEVGEVTQALLGFLGENQRKGQTHTLDDLRTELLDVALAALGAVSHLGGDDEDTVAQLTERAAFVDERLLSAMVARGRAEGWVDADA